MSTAVRAKFGNPHPSPDKSCPIDRGLAGLLAVALGHQVHIYEHQRHPEPHPLTGRDRV